MNNSQLLCAEKEHTNQVFRSFPHLSWSFNNLTDNIEISMKQMYRTFWSTPMNILRTYASWPIAWVSLFGPNQIGIFGHFQYNSIYIFIHKKAFFSNLRYKMVKFWGTKNFDNNFQMPTRVSYPMEIWWNSNARELRLEHIVMISCDFP